MDKRVMLIAVLTVLGIVLTVIRESGEGHAEPFSLLPSSRQPVTADRVHRMADTTLKAQGIKRENIRPIRGRNDVRVLMPPSFDPLTFVKAMRDSLAGYDAQLVSMENARERTTVVQVKNGDQIMKAYIFSKEPATTARKGVPPSQPKKQIR
ncbi:MAG: hypothetical protein HUU02_13385 [Bacteroidetes bacterium]|nr:hypothetical protein [Bacteroidota bacterium]